MLPVSAVVPCYRCASTIERAVQSIAAQTARPLEVILVDDASDDGSLRLLHEIRERLGRDWIRIISLGENKGPSTARNAGWDAARGEYVAFLDSDDSWHARKLELQHEFMRKKPELALSGHLHSLGRFEGNIELPLRSRPMRFRELLFRNRILPSSVMLRRDIPLRFREGQRHMEDHLLFTLMAFKGYPIALLEARLAAQFKPQFGASGLSAQLVAMERGELSNYRMLYREGAVGPVAVLMLWVWSLLKFGRRLAIVALRR